MKKYLPYIGITSVLLIIALYHFFHDKSGTLKVDNRYFSIPDTSKVTKIMVISGSDTLLLQKSTENWSVNRKYYAKSKLILQLLGMFSTVEIQEPVPHTIKNGIMKEFALRSLRISFGDGKKNIRTYRVMEIDTLNIGTFAMMDGDADPYIIHIPDFDGRISKLFPTNPIIWRESVVFRYQPYEILDVTVEYPEKTDKSFKLDLNDPSNIRVLSLTSSSSEGISKENVVKYLYNFSLVGFQPLVRENYKELYDSLINSKPVCIVTVSDISENISTVSTYRIPIQKKNENFDMFKMYAVIQKDSIPVFVKYIDFDPIMKELSDFLAK